MDGTLHLVDLLTIAMLTASTSLLLRVLLRPPRPPHQASARPTPPGPPEPPRVEPARGLRGPGTVLAGPPPPDSRRPAAPGADEFSSWPVRRLPSDTGDASPPGDRPHVGTSPAAVTALLVADTAAALERARDATDRHHLDIVQHGQVGAVPSRATCRSTLDPWPPTRLIVLGSARSTDRDAAVHHAAGAQVPLLLPATTPTPSRHGRQDSS